MSSVEEKMQYYRDNNEKKAINRIGSKSPIRVESVYQGMQELLIVSHLAALTQLFIDRLKSSLTPNLAAKRPEDPRMSDQSYSPAKTPRDTTPKKKIRSFMFNIQNHNITNFETTKNLYN
jgi:hypothetical protein